MLPTKVSLNSSFPSSSFEQEIAPCSSICNASYATKSKRKQEFWHLVPSLFLLITHSLRVRAINWTNTFRKLECFMVCPCRPPPYSSTTRLCLSSLPRMSCSINFPVNTLVFIEWPHFFISIGTNIDFITYLQNIQYSVTLMIPMYLLAVFCLQYKIHCQLRTHNFLIFIEENKISLEPMKDE